MKINSIMLKNIRSFVDQEIIFNKGITLLSGDIGSGKSTVLLGLCFALFGISRGFLTGNAILRNGESDGLVRLNFSIDDKDIIIERKLKRDSNINQMPGKIVINNEENVKTPVELKQIILELLNYPKEYLTKSKDLIFYYTVFTPQEEMKSILLGDKELRLETLRKVFGIDKYSRIKENTIIFSRVLRERREELKGFISDLEYKEEDLRMLKNKKEELEKVLKPVMKEIELKYGELKDADNSLNVMEEKLKSLREIKSLANVTNNNIKNMELQIEKLSDNKNNLKIKIENLEKELRLDNKIDNKIIENIENERIVLRNLINNRALITENMGKIKANIRASEEIIDQIKTIDNCPLCFQKVGHAHKSSITDQQFKIIVDSKIRLNQLINDLSRISEEINKKDMWVQDLNEQKSRYELIKFKNESLGDFNDGFNLLKEQINVSEKEIKELKEKNLELNEKLSDYSNIENEFLEIRKRLEDLRYEEKKLLIKQQAIKSDIENNEIFIIKITEEINVKKEAKKKLDRIIRLNEFFSNSLITITSAIEKTVMLKLNQEFNSFFQRFFSLLINSENINVKLNYEFTPLIIQNGYDIEYTNLSGGEKTAVALAYRLALNKVLNTIYSTIKTNNLIILDEPTDGFSEEQLDKLRDVIKELNAEQIIIVSHESKIESFAENIIRLEKTGHVSQVYNI